jgi:hypothetical protein
MKCGNLISFLLLVFKVLLIRAFSTEYHIHPFVIVLNSFFQSVQVEIVSYVFIIYLRNNHEKKLYLDKEFMAFKIAEPGDPSS